ncbi:hypothetical protein RclHR1_03460015 [Rhizophagus clarus]|uniref:Uncharacterized protein n=1 Tax=Rhizophagus clarus TaxID=94130 RepID=A0A2Z6S4Q1_9GLOM|nr:hypothetical protein RclHR1_03460015 [Rhizophagus clarus]
MDKVRFFRRLRISQIIITAFICLIEKSRIYLYKRKPHFVDIPFNLTYTTLDFVDFVDCEYYIADNYERGLHLGNVSFDQAYISDSALDFVDCGNNFAANCDNATENTNNTYISYYDLDVYDEQEQFR